MKKRPPGPTKTATTPENVGKVGEAMVCTLGRLKNGATATVNSKLYCLMLQNFLRSNCGDTI